MPWLYIDFSTAVYSRQNMIVRKLLVCVAPCNSLCVFPKPPTFFLRLMHITPAMQKPRIASGETTAHGAFCIAPFLPGLWKPLPRSPAMLLVCRNLNSQRQG